MTSFSQAKDLFRMQKEAKKIKKQLKKIQVEAESGGVKVIVSAEQEILDIIIDPNIELSTLPASLMDALNRALGKAQVVASEQMQGVMGSMGIPTTEGMRGLTK